MKSLFEKTFKKNNNKIPIPIMPRVVKFPNTKDTDN